MLRITNATKTCKHVLSKIIIRQSKASKFIYLVCDCLGHPAKLLFHHRLMEQSSRFVLLLGLSCCQQHRLIFTHSLNGHSFLVCQPWSKTISIEKQTCSGTKQKANKMGCREMYQSACRCWGWGDCWAPCWTAHRRGFSRTPSPEKSCSSSLSPRSVALAPSPSPRFCFCCSDWGFRV